MGTTDPQKEEQTFAQVKGVEEIPHPHGHHHSLKLLVTVNIVFGIFCLISFFVVTYIILARSVQDLFVKYALWYLLLALFVRIVMSAMIGFKD